VVGGSDSILSSSTQVSLVPPPCDELTTSEPSLSATRVSPPGTICTWLARQHEGPQVDVARRDADSTKVGQVDRLSVGWAM
jgi:hypothetical protein